MFIFVLGKLSQSLILMKAILVPCKGSRVDWAVEDSDLISFTCLSFKPTTQSPHCWAVFHCHVFFCAFKFFYTLTGFLPLSLQAGNVKECPKQTWKGELYLSANSPQLQYVTLPVHCSLYLWHGYFILSAFFPHDCR